MLNKAIIMGRLTRDPEIRHTNSGKAVMNFTVAVESGYGDKKQTDFINCVAWGNQAEFMIDYFTKGMMIIVIGRISTRSWDSQDGRKNYTTEVVASEVSFGETKKNREQNNGGYRQQNRGGYSQQGGYSQNDFCDDMGDIPDDLPFD